MRTEKKLTKPVNMSNISAPKDHQSTAFPWPLLVKISGALKNKRINVEYKMKSILFKINIQNIIKFYHIHTNLSRFGYFHPGRS